METTVQKLGKFEMVKIARLKDAWWSPPERTQRVDHLMRSLEYHLQLTPILITPDKQIIKGHRRKAAAEQLGWIWLEAKVLEGVPEEIYATLLATEKRLNGNALLGLFLNSPEVLPQHVRQKLTRAQEVVGRALLRRIHREKFSVHIYCEALSFARFVDDASSLFVRQTLTWLLDHAYTGSIYQARGLMMQDSGKDLLLKAIAANRPLRVVAG